MRNVTLAFGSFIVGAASAFMMFSGTQASTLVHPQVALEMVGKEPVVPPLGPRFINSSILGQRQGLDGLNCSGCTIESSEITYGGGAFNLENCLIRKNRVTLTGSALNTFKFLMMVGVIPAPRPNEIKPKNPMMPAKIEMSLDAKVSWSTPEPAE
jgi:hypothetical protein